MTVRREDLLLLAAIQDGIPLADSPFQEIGAAAGMDEEEVLMRLRALLSDGTIRRFGARIDHLALGIIANAMVCWKVPADDVERVGEILSLDPEITHCYEREIVPGRWEYNLFCVIHGYSEAQVEQKVRKLEELAGITDHILLFSRKKFKHISVAVGFGREGNI